MQSLALVAIFPKYIVNYHNGRSYTYLTYGRSTCPFQRVLDALRRALPGIVSWFNDVLTYMRLVLSYQASKFNLPPDAARLKMVPQPPVCAPSATPAPLFLITTEGPKGLAKGDVSQIRPL